MSEPSDEERELARALAKKQRAVILEVEALLVHLREAGDPGDLVEALEEALVGYRESADNLEILGGADGTDGTTDAA